MNILQAMKKMLRRREHSAPKDVPDSKREVIEHLRNERVPEIQRRLEYLGLDGKNIRREDN